MLKQGVRTRLLKQLLLLLLKWRRSLREVELLTRLTLFIDTSQRAVEELRDVSLSASALLLQIHGCAALVGAALRRLHHAWFRTSVGTFQTVLIQLVDLTLTQRSPLASTT